MISHRTSCLPVRAKSRTTGHQTDTTAGHDVATVGHHVPRHRTSRTYGYRSHVLLTVTLTSEREQSFRTAAHFWRNVLIDDDGGVS